MPREGKVLKAPSAGPEFIIVEGFKIFAEPKLVNTCNYLIWLDADCETCFKRAAKPGRPGHPAEGCSREEYEGHRWPAHLEWKDIMWQNATSHPSGPIVLDNSEDADQAELVRLAKETLLCA